MEKRTYIQPEMNVEIFHMEAIMLPNSPTDGTSDPHLAAKRLAPANPVIANDTVPVF